MNYFLMITGTLLLLSCQPENDRQAFDPYKKQYREFLQRYHNGQRELVGTGMLLEFQSLTMDDLADTIAAAHGQLFPERRGNAGDLLAIRKMLRDGAPDLCDVSMHDTIPDFEGSARLLLENRWHFCSLHFDHSVDYQLDFCAGEIVSLIPKVQACRSHTDGSTTTSVTTTYYGRKQIVYLYVRILADDLPPMTINLSDTVDVYSASPKVNERFLQGIK